MLANRIKQDIYRLSACKCISFVLRSLSNLNALDQKKNLNNCLTALPSKAKVVICGGGVMGAAVAYHLSKRGWGGETIVIEKEW